MTFGLACLEHCPKSADLAAALRCIRLGHAAMNEYVHLYLASGIRRDILLDIAEAEYDKARWQAISSISCEGR